MAGHKISIGFGYVQTYRHVENVSSMTCVIEKYIKIYIYGNKIEYLHIFA